MGILQVYMKKIYLIRHPETFANLNYNGPKDITKKGFRQMSALCDRLNDLEINCIVSSELDRAAKMAFSLATEHPEAELSLDSNLNEIDQRSIGLPKNVDSYFLSYFRDRCRVNRSYKRYFVDNDEKTSVIVAHGNIIRYFLTKIIGTMPSAGRNFELHQTSLTEVRKNRYWYVYSVNDYSHLSSKDLSSR